MSADRSAVVPLAVAVFCILSVGVAAATLDSAEAVGATEGDQFVEPPSVDDRDTGGSGSSRHVNDTGDSGNRTFEERQEVTACVEPLASTPGTIGLVVAFFAAVGLIYSRYNFSLSILAGWTLLPPVMLAYFLLTDCGPSGSGFQPGGGSALESAGDSFVPVGSVPPSAVGALVGLVFVGAVVLFYRSVGEEQTVVPDDASDDDDEPALSDFAAAAGDAADRIEEHNADVDNSVYEAWLEMTGLLDVDDPEMYSAGDFAEEAIGVGMASDDVQELTQLFNEVRYGDRDAAVREDRALEVLRTIESEYGGQGSGSADGDSADEADAADAPADETENTRTDDTTESKDEDER